MSFFPNGFQEPAIIFLEDEATGAVFSIKTEPLTGRVMLYSREIDIPDEFGQGESDD